MGPIGLQQDKLRRYLFVNLSVSQNSENTDRTKSAPMVRNRRKGAYRLRKYPRKFVDLTVGAPYTVNMTEDNNSQIQHVRKLTRYKTTRTVVIPAQLVAASNFKAAHHVVAQLIGPDEIRLTTIEYWLSQKKDSNANSNQ